MKNSSIVDTRLQYDSKSIDITIGTKLLEITMDSALQWKAHIALLSMKVNVACYALRTLKHTMSQQVSDMVYFSYFHSIMSYGIIFLGASPHCTNIFKLPKKEKEKKRKEKKRKEKKRKEKKRKEKKRKEKKRKEKEKKKNYYKYWKNGVMYGAV
jgi:hypothetical protein